MESLILVGFGGHAKSVLDCIEKSRQYRIIGFTDVTPNRSCHAYPYLGNDDILKEYYDQGVASAFIALGYMGQSVIRDVLYQKLKRIGFRLPVIADPSAVLAEDATVGEGSFIGKNAVVNTSAVVGKMCIINTGAIVEHENQIGDFTHVSVNSTLCGGVEISDHCFIGAGAIIIQNRKIGKNSVIGAGSVVLRDVRPEEQVYGIVSKNRGGGTIRFCHYERAG